MKQLPILFAQKFYAPQVASKFFELGSIFAIATLVAIFRFQVLGNSLSPNNDDGVYWSQAIALKSLHLSPQSPFPDLPQWFMVHLQSGLVPKYLPTMALYSLLVSTPFGFTQYAFLTALLSLFSLRFFLVEIGASRWARMCALVFVGLNPLFFIHSSVLLTYIPSFTLGVFTIALTLRGVRLNSKWLLAASGVAVGILATMRQLDAVCFSLALVLFLVWRRQILRSIKLLHFLFAGVFLVAIPTTAYCFLVVGRVELPFNLISGQDSYWFGYKAMVPGENFSFNIAEASNATIRSLQDLGLWGALLPFVLITPALLVKKNNQNLALGFLTVAAGSLWFLLYYPFWGVAHSQRWWGSLIFGPFYFIPALFFLLVGLAIVLGRRKTKSMPLHALQGLALFCVILAPWSYALSPVSHLAAWAKVTQQYSADLERFSGGEKVGVILPTQLNLGNPVGEFSNTLGSSNIYYLPLNSASAINMLKNKGVSHFASIETDFSPVYGTMSYLKIVPQKLLVGSSFDLKVSVPENSGNYVPRLVIDNGVDCIFYDLLSKESVQFSLSPNFNQTLLLAGAATPPGNCVPHPSNLPLQIRLLQHDVKNLSPDRVVQDTFYPNVSDGKNFREILAPGISASALPQINYLELIPSEQKAELEVTAKNIALSFPNPNPRAGFSNRLVIDRLGVCQYWDLDTNSRNPLVVLGPKPSNVLVVSGSNTPPRACKPNNSLTLPLQVRLLSHNYKTNLDSSVLFDDWFFYSLRSKETFRVNSHPSAHSGSLPVSGILFTKVSSKKSVGWAIYNSKNFWKTFSGNRAALTFANTPAPNGYSNRLIIDRGGVCLFWDLDPELKEPQLLLGPEPANVTMLSGAALPPRPCKSNGTGLPLMVNLVRHDVTTQTDIPLSRDWFQYSQSAGKVMKIGLYPLAHTGIDPTSRLRLRGLSDKLPSGFSLDGPPDVWDSVSGSVIFFNFLNPKTPEGFVNRLVVDRGGICRFWDLDSSMKFPQIRLGSNPEDVALVSNSESKPVVCQAHDPSLPLQIRLLRHENLTLKDTPIFDDWFDYQVSQNNIIKIGKFPIARNYRERKIFVVFTNRLM
ncbi:MAG: hypothetical protein EBT07_04620 [Actinobacteria bacterium]|nr:hypothetical protein [Actinomycetota bacterium]